MPALGALAESSIAARPPLRNGRLCPHRQFARRRGRSRVAIGCVPAPGLVDCHGARHAACRNRQHSNRRRAKPLGGQRPDASLPAGRTAARLHLFAPRTCLATRSAEDLLLYTTPALPAGWRAPQTLVLMLLLFAGQLYLRTYNDYVDMCQLLGAPYCQLI